MALSLQYFDGDELAASVWINKYAMKDSFGNLFEASPDHMHRRLAKEYARIEANYPNPMLEDEIFDLLKEFKYIIPQGGPMTGIGNNHQVASLSNCFVIGHRVPADSYGWPNASCAISKAYHSSGSRKATLCGTRWWPA